MSRQYCDQLSKVNITALCRQYPQLKTQSHVDLYLGSGVHQVRLQRSKAHYGGTRTWFTCRCGKRVGVIYEAPHGIGCINCLDIDHRSRWESCPKRRIKRWIAKRRAQLNLGDRRPKFMRHKTYERLLHEIEQLEALYVASGIGGMGRLTRVELEKRLSYASNGV